MLPLAQAVGRIRAQGGLVYAPHPFDPGRSSLGPALAPLCGSGLVDAIEVVNAKVADPAHNQQAAGLAARFGLPGGAGSDAHDPAGIGAAYAELPDFDGPAGFLDALHRALSFRRVPAACPALRRAPGRPAARIMTISHYPISCWARVASPLPARARSAGQPLAVVAARRRGTARWPWPA